MIDSLPFYNFQVVQDRIDSLVVATGNKLEREWPTRLSGLGHAAVLLRSVVVVAGNTHQSILYLCADNPPDVQRKSEYAASIPPLARTLLDSVFLVVYLFEDLATRANWYYKSGWRELVEERDRLRAKYADSPNWESWLSEFSCFVDHTRDSWGVSGEEEQDPRRIRYWPHPGRMLRDKSLSGARHDFLVYLNDWFYRHLSSASHLSWPGLASRSHFFFFDKQDADEREKLLEKYRSDVVTMAATLLMTLLSEIELEMRFGLGQRLSFVWTFFDSYYDDAKEIYESRYRDELA